MYLDEYQGLDYARRWKGISIPWTTPTPTTHFHPGL